MVEFGRRTFLKGAGALVALLAAGRLPSVPAAPVVRASAVPIVWDPLADGQWHHLAVTYAKGELKRYVDGVLCELELPPDVQVVDWKGGPFRFSGLPDDDYTAQWAQRRVGEPRLYDRTPSGHYQQFISTQFDDVAIFDHVVDEPVLIGFAHSFHENVGYPLYNDDDAGVQSR